MLKNTLTKVNSDGANKKNTFRFNGKLVVIKDRIQENCYDNIVEELIYKIAAELGIPCSPAGVLPDNKCYSEIDENVFSNLIEASEYLGIDEGKVHTIYDKICRKGCDNTVKFRFLQMQLFDVLTRQIDRNLTNFSFILDEASVRMYRLYDNGLALFSTLPYNNKETFIMRTRESSKEIMEFCVNELNNLNLTYNIIFKGLITKDFLLSIMKQYQQDITNDINSIADWVLNQQTKIFQEFQK